MDAPKILTDHYPNGMVRTRSCWVDRQNGIVQGWREDGRQEYEIIIEKGLRVCRKIWDDFGRAYVQRAQPVTEAAA